jgi:hypothetical protein
MPQAIATSAKRASPSKGTGRIVLRPTQQAFDAAAAVRAERQAQAGSKARGRGPRGCPVTR